MITCISRKIASFFVRSDVIKSEDEEVYEYGLQILLSTVFNGIIALMLALISGTVLQSACYLFVFILLRKSAGGFHAKTHFGCCCILAVVLSIFILFIKYAPMGIYTLVSAVALSFSVIIILLFAPLEHENKPIRVKDRERLRRISIVYMILFSVLTFVLFITKLKTAMVCVALGMFTASGSMLVAFWQKSLLDVKLR